MIRRVLVLGGGTAGLLAALSVKTRVPALEVCVLRSTELGVIGVGEGSTVALPTFLHGFLAIDPGEFLKRAEPIWKLGLRFVEWGPREFFHYSFAPSLQVRWNKLPKLAGYFCDDHMDGIGFAVALMEENRAFLRLPDGGLQMQRDFGYHLENARFVDFLEACARQRGIELLDDTVDEVRRIEGGVGGLVLKSGREEQADLYVDSSGFRSLLLGETLKERFRSFQSTLYCDRAIVGGWPRRDEVIKPYTTAQTMSAGWCWQIEHEHRINRGYVYSSDFISDDAAEHEFRAQNSEIEGTRIVRFRSGRYENAWVGNVVAIGNACGFVEPLEATSLGAISSESALLSEIILDSDRDPSLSQIRYFNEVMGLSWDNIRRFLAIHYKFNTRFDTPFWRACRADIELAGAEPIIDFYAENGPTDLARQSLLNPYDQFTMDGWLTLFVGQKVPHRKRYTPSTVEMELWQQIRTQIRSRARQGFTVKEALAIVRSPQWKWNSNFFPS